MKTNHRRGFVAQKDSERYKFSPIGDTGQLAELSGLSIGAGWGGDNANGHQGYAKAKRGGKKFVRSRVRFHENAATKHLAETDDGDLD